MVLGTFTEKEHLQRVLDQASIYLKDEALCGLESSTTCFWHLWENTVAFTKGVSRFATEKSAPRIKEATSTKHVL